MARGTRLGRVLCGIGLVWLIAVLPAWSALAYASEHQDARSASHAAPAFPQAKVHARRTADLTAVVLDGDVAVASRSSHGHPGRGQVVYFELAIVAAVGAWMGLGLYVGARTRRAGFGSTRTPTSLRNTLAEEAELWLREH